MAVCYSYVKIIGSHPHSGANGRIKFVDGETEVKSILGGPPMYLVEIEDDGTGVESCFAERRFLALRPAPTQGGE